MYVACVPLKVDGRRVNPGDPVPEADTWVESARRAHLSLGWIKEQLVVEQSDSLIKESPLVNSTTNSADSVSDLSMDGRVASNEEKETTRMATIEERSFVSHRNKYRRR